MKCKRCGKALGTDRGICPFCGSLLSKEQVENYRKAKEEKMFEPEMITEKYGEKLIYYEKSKEKENKVLGLIVILGVLAFLLLITAIFVLN